MMRFACSRCFEPTSGTRCGDSQEPGVPGAPRSSRSRSVSAPIRRSSASPARCCCARFPIPQADRLVILWNRSPGLGITEDWFSTAQYFDVKNAGSGLEHVAHRLRRQREPDRRRRSPERIGTLRVSSNLLDHARRAAGGRPAVHRRGRRADAGQRRASSATDTWVRRYGSDPNVVGRRLELNGRRYQIVGVLPAVVLAAATRSCRRSATPPTPTS